MLNYEEILDSIEIKEFKNQCIQKDTIYVKSPVYALSSKKLESLMRIAELQKYYQCNPVRFISDFFNIELLDAQAWIITRAWTCPNVLLVCTRGFGKSTLIDLMLMAKGMLFSNYWSYICSGSSSQAQQTFTTLERLASDNIDTMLGSTGYIFKQEVEIKNAAGDGFSHSSDGFSYNLYNGSMTQTLNSNIDKKRGMRGNVVFDESAFLSEEMLNTYAAFAIVNKSFKSGKDRNGNILDMNRLRSIPEEIPNQLFYISSASSTDTEYYRLYRDFSKRMLIGNPNYFVAQIDCEVVFKPTMHGEVVAPLLTEETVKAAQRVNPEKANREYRCIFTTDAGEKAIVKRGTITRNEEVRKPLLYNDTGDKKFIITYDPARRRDNSVILVMEVYGFGTGNIKGRIVNCINLIDVGKKIKSPMKYPDQIEYLKQVILDYNGPVDDYQNILGVYIDGGSGGGGTNIPDYLLDDWVGKDGKIHRGIIDKEYSEEEVKKYQKAIPILHVMSPSKYKSEMFETMINLLDQDIISFTASYDNKGYLTTFDEDKELIDKIKKDILTKNKNITSDKLNEALNQELSKMDTVKTKVIKLDWQDEIALTNIDALKEELEYRLGLRKLIQKCNPFNCWKTLKIFKPQHKDEIYLSVMV